ncbi:MAG: hypothetical protein BMS9Abin30_0514 [Gammaproteobacteria bacterium]|nr:MAG: hypothetical protein BMS9Abin30_0514 [Gammaproteobacteria bacterium]
MLKQPIWLMHARMLFLCFIIAALSSVTPARADVLYLNDSLDSEEVIRNLKAELAPAPLFENKRGKFFYGKVLSYRRGTHNRPPDDTSFDRVLFQAHGRKGARPSRNPVEIPVSVIDWLVHEYDGPNDFVFQFSDRHELLKTPFGSPLHRASLFRLFSPQDPQAMPGKSEVEIPGTVREGTLTRFLISGPPSMNEMPMASWSMHAPDFLFPGHYAGDNEGLRFNELWPNGTRALLLAMARAREYPAFDQEVGKMAREAAGLLCSMALQDKDVPLSPGIQIRARRAMNSGLKCFRDIASTLQLTREGFNTITREEFTGGDVMPVSISNYMLAAIDLIESKEFFSRYINPVQPSQDGVVYFPSNPSPFGLDSGEIVRALANLAGGFSEASQSPEVRRTAEGALVRMIAPGPDESREQRREMELSRRNFRAQIMRWSEKYVTTPGEPGDRPPNPRAENWLMGLYCHVGWGNHLDISAFAKQRINRARSYLKDFEGGGARPELAADAERYIRQVGLMQRTALSGGRMGMFLRESIENQIAEIRESRRPENKTFIQIYDGYMAEELNCEGYQAEN